MDPLAKFKNWIMVICCMSNSGNASVDIEKAATTPVYGENEEEEEEEEEEDNDDDDKVDEADKAVSGFSATCGSLLFGGPVSVLFVFNPEAHGHELDGDSRFMWLVHDGSLAAILVAMSLACVLLCFTVADPAPSRRATRIKKRIAHTSLFWLVLGVFSRIYLALPLTYRNPVTVLTGGGLSISAVFLLYPVLLRGSTRNRNRKKPKSSPVFPVVDDDKIVNYALNTKENPPKVHDGNSTTEGTDTTQGRMAPVKGGGGLSSPFEDTGDPSVQSNQGINQPSSRKGKQAIHLAKTVKSYEKRVKDEADQMAKAMKLLDEVPGIKKYSHEWLLTVFLLQDCITREFFIGIDNPSSRGNWIQWNYYDYSKQQSKEVTARNEVREEFSSMMRTLMATRESRDCSDQKDSCGRVLTQWIKGN